jgi:DNA-binding response OmpR family regulator
MQEKTRVLTDDEVKALLRSERAGNGNDKIRTLIVEDDRTTGLLYDKGLFDQIFDKKIIVSGKEALRVYQEWHPEIIILDIYLPEMTGYQVLKTIRTVIGDMKTAIVMATTLSGPEDVLSCMKMGIEGYIIKPFSCSDIGAKVLGYYAKKQPERARMAEASCREIAKQYQKNLLLEQDRSKTNENREDQRNGAGASGTETGESEIEIEAVEKPDPAKV